MSVTPFRSTASMRTLTRGFASSARCSAEATAPSTPAALRPQPNNHSQRTSQSNNRGSDRLRAGHRNRSANQHSGQNGNRNAGGERRNKRLPSVFDASSASTHARPARGAGIKSLGREQRTMPAPVPSTDWNSPLFSQPGFQRLLAAAPRPSGLFTPDLAAAPSPAAGKGKAKAASPAATVVNARLNLPGIKDAVNALKLHVRPGGRNILGPVNNPTGVAAGSMSQNRVTLAHSAGAKDKDDKSLAAELKAARIALQNEQIGGSYERFEPEAVLKVAGIQTSAQTSAEGASPQINAIQNAAQALAVNADLAPEAKSFVAKTISERLSA